MSARGWLWKMCLKILSRLGSVLLFIGSKVEADEGESMVERQQDQVFVTDFLRMNQPRYTYCYPVLSCECSRGFTAKPQGNED